MLKRWWRRKRFNAKLITTNMIKKLRINVLVSASPFGRMYRCSATVSALAGGVSWTLDPWGIVPHVTASGINLTLVAGTFPLLLFQGVHPVTLSISLRIALESCALKAGSLNGFLMGLVWAGGIPPLPLPPLPPLSHCWHLGSMVTGSWHPLVGTLQNKIVDWPIGQSFEVDNM